VSNLDQTVDLGAALHTRFTSRSPVHRGEDSGFPRRLRSPFTPDCTILNCLPSARLAETESSPADHYPFCRITRWPMRQNSRTAAWECARKSSPISTLRKFTTCGCKHRIAAQADAFADGHKRPDGAVSPKTALGGDVMPEGVCRLRRGRLIEKAQSPREIEVGFSETRQARPGIASAARMGWRGYASPWARTWGCQEGKLARPSVLHAGHSGGCRCPPALQTAPQPFGQSQSVHDVVGITSSVPRAVR